MGIELLAVSSQHPGSTLMMREDHQAVCLVLMSVLEGLVAADMTREHYGAAHRRRQSGLYVVKMATEWSYDRRHKASVRAEAGVASQRCGCQQKCAVAGSGCREEMLHFQGCCLHSLQEPEWRVGEAVEVVVADAQLAV